MLLHRALCTLYSYQGSWSILWHSPKVSCWLRYESCQFWSSWIFQLKHEIAFLSSSDSVDISTFRSRLALTLCGIFANDRLPLLEITITFEGISISAFFYTFLLMTWIHPPFSFLLGFTLVNDTRTGFVLLYFWSYSSELLAHFSL